MKKYFCILISILCLITLLCACEKKENPAEPISTDETTSSVEENIPLDSNIVGTWNYVDATGNPQPEMKGWIFNEDKTGVDTVFDLSFTYETIDGYVELCYDDETLGIIETRYKYTIKDALLTMTRDVNGAETFSYMKEGSK